MSDKRQEHAYFGKRVGFLLASMHTGVSTQIWPPLVDLAKRKGVELFIFPGGRLKAEDPAEAVRTRVFSLADKRNLDGAVSWASSLGGFVGPSELNEFHARMGDLPLVAMAHHVPGKPVVRIDAYSGMLSLVAHMIEIHGVRKIAFIRGPEEHESAEDRRKAFADAHRRAGLELDPRLVAAPRPWNAGKAAIEELLDERGLIPGRDFEALMAASDLQLHSAVRVLQSRGYSIPTDLLTAGFNDSIESRILSPSVTTVRLPFARQAEHAFLKLLHMFEGASETTEEVLPSELVVRQSCGCISASVRNAGRMPAESRRKASDPEEGLGAVLLSAATRCTGANLEERSAWLKPLVDEFEAALEPALRVYGGAGAGREAAGRIAFLQTLDRIMERLIHIERDLEPWQDVLSVFRSHTLPRVGPAAKELAEDLIGQGRVIVSEAVSRAHSLRVWKASTTAQILRDLERDLIRMDDRADLGPALAKHLGALGIAAAFVAEEFPAEKTARLIAGFDERGVLPPECLAEFDPAELLPSGILPPPEGRSWLVEPLCAGEGYFGRLVVQAGVRESAVYEELRGALSSALQGLRSIDEIRRARAAAEKAEVLKSRFLASVSGELRAPLKGITEAAEAAVRELAGLRGAVRVPPSVPTALSSIRNAANRQLVLTDDLLDLARCEAGELQLTATLVRPETLVSRALSAAESAVSYREPASPLPLVSGDPARLARLLALLFDRARPAELSISAETCYLAFSVRRADGGSVPSEEEGGLGRSVSFARRLVSAHMGRLEAISEKGKPAGWLLRLPYPTLNGGSPPAGSPEDGRVLLLSDAAAIPEAVRPAVELRPDRWVQAALSRVKADPSLLSGVSSLAWVPPPPQREASEAAVLRSLAKNPSLSALPFLLFPRDRTDCPAADLAQYLAEAALSGEAGAVAVCDPDTDRGSALAAALAVSGSPDPIAASSPEELAALRGDVPPSVIVLRTAAPLLIASARKTVQPARKQPAIVVLCGLLDDRVDLTALEADPRAVLFNEGVLSTAELSRFIRALAEGRALLPPYTGAIVKRAQRYLNRHVSSPITRWKIAEEINVSEDYLTRVFKKELGLSPWEYLMRLRVQVARLMLRETSESVRSVAEASGFQDQAYFCRVFRKIAGRSPSDFRNDPRHITT